MNIAMVQVTHIHQRAFQQLQEYIRTKIQPLL